MEGNRKITFLVATDIHLGHKENHNIRGNDSFEAFSQVLEIAKIEKVDFMLLGGDLFDEVNPSKETYYRCLNTLKNNIFGIRKPKIKATMNGDESYQTNFSSGLNISLPIFTIHGNHDYPANDFGRLSSCDLLQASSYVNYFGKYMDLRSILIKPIIIQKPEISTKIAIYGLGYIKDIPLNVLFEKELVTFEKPQGDLKNYITIFVLHQNRWKKSFKVGAPISKCISSYKIPEWINLTIWGHQHEAINKIEVQNGRKIFQPGSTVLTSFVETQSYKKQCAVISVEQRKFSLQPILLEKSFRPLYVRNYNSFLLKQKQGQTFDLTSYLQKEIDTILKQCQHLKLPIIRIKYQYSEGDEQRVSSLMQLEKNYSEKVANPGKIIAFSKKKVEKKLKVSEEQFFDALKSKKQMQKRGNTVIQEVFEKMQQNLQKKTFNIYQNGKAKQLLEKTVLQRSRPEINSFLTKQLVNSSSNYVRKLNQTFDHREKQYMKAMNFYKKHIDEALNKPLANFTEDPMQIEEIDLSDQYLNCEKFDQLNAKIDQIINNPFGDKQSQHEDTRKSNTSLDKLKIEDQPPLKKPKNTSFMIKSDSDSQDCCQRAQKSELDEELNKLKFDEAVKEMKRKEIIKKKKTSEVSKKNVRFSTDFM